MTEQEIREVAPSGATHYSDIGIDIIYLRWMLDEWECFVFGSWKPYIAEDDEIIKPL